MKRTGSIGDLKKSIETKRDELNTLMDGDIDKDKVLKFSIELDKLIYEYCKFERDNKKEASM